MMRPDAMDGTMRVPFVRHASDGQRTDTLMIWEDEIPAASTISLNGVSFPLPYQFSDHRLFAFAMDGSGIIVIDRPVARNSAGGEFAIIKVDPEGDTIYNRRYAYTPKRTPNAEVARIARNVRSGYERMRLGPLGRDVELPSPAQIERALRQRGVPELLVPITSITTGQDGTLWLGGDDGDSEIRPWYVFDSTGEPVANVSLPRRENVVAVQGRILVTTYSDDLDVPYLIGYRIAR
jgi:outer membrane protein assembly factor BamB